MLYFLIFILTLTLCILWIHNFHFFGTTHVVFVSSKVHYESNIFLEFMHIFYDDSQ
jgi:hypothetical protein